MGYKRNIKSRRSDIMHAWGCDNIQKDSMQQKEQKEYYYESDLQRYERSCDEFGERKQKRRIGYTLRGEWRVANDLQNITEHGKRKTTLVQNIRQAYTLAFRALFAPFNSYCAPTMPFSLIARWILLTL